MPPRLQIKLLGDFRLARADEPSARLVTARLQALLCHLALHRGTPQSRARIAFLFWPDSSEKQALTNLRHLLHELRKILPESGKFIQADSRTIVWDGAADVSLDVAEFGESLAAADAAERRSDAAAARTALEGAVRLYAGELLPGCTHDWIAADRERLRRDCVGVLERLIGVCEEARDYPAALQHARRLQQLEPAHEASYCALMRLHMFAGDRAAALHAYKQGVAELQRELAIGPGQAMRDLYDRLLGGEPIKPRAVPPSVSGPEFPLHGRHHEWLQLRNAWARSAEGRAQLVVILGEPGIGKSRLAEELGVWVERQGGVAARTRSYAAEGRLAFAPAAQWLRSPGLQRHLARLDAIWCAEIARILPELRGNEPARWEPDAPRESWRQHRFFEGLSRAVLAGGEPVLLVLDDMQWTDRETLEWLRFLLRFAPEARLLVVGTVRTEELERDHPVRRLLFDLQRDERVIELQLGPLAAAESVLVAADVAGRALSSEEASWVCHETAGNPLFVVEWARAGLRGAEAPVPSSPESAGAQLPPKVHAVITGRLGRLSPPARELAGVVAVVGRACTVDELVAIFGQPDAAIVPALEELWERHVLRETASGIYDFSHDKLRDVAYAQLSVPRRQMLHRRIADVLERLNAAHADAVWTQVAAHFEAAGRATEALAAYQRAAEAAKRVHANEEAARLFQKALALLAVLPPAPERVERELELSTALGVCLIASHGYPDSGVWGVYERAVELCRQLGRPTAAPILRALAIASLTSGDLGRAEALGRELLAAHARDGNPIVYVEAHYVLGVSYFWMGRFAESRTHLAEAIAHYDPSRRDIHLAVYAQDPKAICLGRLAWTLAYLGLPEQALARLDEALAVVRELDHPHTRAYVLYFGAVACLDLRAEARATELLCELEEVTTKYTLSFWEYRGNVVRSLRRAEAQGRSEDFAQVEVHMAMPHQAGGPVNASQFLGWKARAYLRCGAIREGLAAIEQAFALFDRIDERYYEAELHRLRGELLRAQGSDAGGVETCFERALHLAREQGARLLELRAAMSLGRLWRSQRRKRPARELLARACGAFSEGFGTADLQEARALLDEWK